MLEAERSGKTIPTAPFPALFLAAQNFTLSTRLKIAAFYRNEKRTKI
jgi:hypothetical protein